MGDPKKTRKKYQKPGHPWEAERLKEEAELMTEYGMKNKRELWKMRSLLRRILRQAKIAIAATGTQAEKEKQNMMKKLAKLGFIKEGAGIDDILGLTLKNIMERRLQTMVFKKGFAKTIGQSRQFIVHEHVYIHDKKITAPSYIVPLAEEPSISFAPNSGLSNPDHPQRVANQGKKP